ncbi:hypothetical protein MBLNU459_g8501t2 [Dothideomycetes sp. NU459]
MIVPSTTTGTFVVTITSDDTSSVTASQSPYNSSVLASACSCLRLPPSSTTSTTTVTAIVEKTVASNMAALTTVTPLTTSVLFSTDLEVQTDIVVETINVLSTMTHTPTSFIPSVTTATATNTLVIEKSDVLLSMNSIISDQGYQTFCSALLKYATSTVDVYKSVTSTMSATTTIVTSTVTSSVITTTYPQGLKKRQPLITPSGLTPYPDDYVSSACVRVVPSPSAFTESITSSYTTTATSTVSVGTTTTETIFTSKPASTIACKPDGTNQLVTDGSFECEDSYTTPWGLHNSATFLLDESAPDGYYVVQLSSGEGAAYIDFD